MPKKTNLSPTLYRQRHLLTTSDFVRYCEDNGVRMTPNTLEDIHCRGLLVPAIRLLRGVIPYRKIYAVFNGKMEWRYVSPDGVNKFTPEKIEKRKYWSEGSIYKDSEDHWLDWYADRGMVKIPAKEPFIDQQLYTGPWITPKLKDVSSRFEYLYDQHQIFALKRILYFFKLNNSGIKDAAKVFDDRFIISEVAKLDKFLAFYFAAEECREKWFAFSQKEFDSFLKDFGGDKVEAEKEWRGHLPGHREMLKEWAQEIVSTHGVSKEQIDDWQIMLAQNTLFNESRRSSKIVHEYLRSLPDEILIKAEDSNFMIHVLNQFLEFLTGEKRTVQQVIGRGWPRYCRICHNQYISKKSNQVTCGQRHCVLAHKNELKRAMNKRAKTA